jgi:hypothetical protein
MPTGTKNTTSEKRTLEGKRQVGLDEAAKMTSKGGAYDKGLAPKATRQPQSYYIHMLDTCTVMLDMQVLSFWPFRILMFGTD